MNTLNVLNRDRSIELLTLRSFDLLIIGGGITGAGIALDAAHKGMRVALIEMQDFSSGTSSRSTKLIHGGLRYLKNLEVGLVMETGRERAILQQNAPHLVHPEKMLLPLMKKGQLGKTTTSFALWVYDFLAGVKKQDRKRMLNKKQTLEIQEGLNEESILAGAIYSEYRTDDSRLTISVLKTATELGAVALNYMQCVGIKYNNKNNYSVEAKDVFSQKTIEISTKQIVNAAGPWVDEIRKMDGPLGKKRLHLTKGVHLVVDNEKLKINQSCYVEIDDGRMIFAIPREGKVYIGTTDTSYQGDKRIPTLDKEDMDYLLKAINKVFPKANLKSKDVLSYWSGLRPLIAEEGKSNSEISRKDEIFISDNGIISIAGGKLTAYRKMAERVVKLVAKSIGNTNKNSTKNVKISGAIDKNELEPEFSEFCENFSNGIFWKNHLWTRYGAHAEEIMRNYYEFRCQEHKEQNILKAEFKYCVENESCYGVYDFFLNRNAWLLFHPEKMEKHLDELMNYSAQILHLSEFSIEVERKKFVNWFSFKESLVDG